MYTRAAKAGSVLLMAAYLTLVAFGNLTDYESNFNFVAHVMSMDTTFEGNKGMWRAVESPVLHHLSYASVIVLEGVSRCCAGSGGCGSRFGCTARKPFTAPRRWRSPASGCRSSSGSAPFS